VSYSEDRLKVIEAKINRYSMVSKLFIVMIALGLYAIFETSGDAFIDILNNKVFVYSMLSLGIICELIILSKLFPLWQEKGILLGKD
jgi:hypothetical protein